MPKIIEATDVAFTSGASVGAFKGAAKNLKNSDYHAIKDYWSSTDLKFMHAHSPTHFHDKYYGKSKDEPKKQTESMILGSLVHTLLLTPNEFISEFFVMPDLNFRTNEGKAKREELLMANPGKIPITDELLYRANAMKSACMANKKAKEFLEPLQKELAFFWTCPFSNLNFKCKVDAASSKYFVELKTTSDASQEAFIRHVDNMNYDLSLVHYGQGIKSVMGVEPPAYFIVIEQEWPHVTQVYKAGQGFYETGHAKWLSAVTKLADGIQKDKWPGYFPEDMEPPEIQPPPWSINKLQPKEVLT